MPLLGRSAAMVGSACIWPRDVTRLIHIKQLVDLGYSIGVVAKLSPTTLASMHAAALGRDLFGGRTARDVRAKTGGRATADLAMQE